MRAILTFEYIDKYLEYTETMLLSSRIHALPGYESGFEAPSMSSLLWGGPYVHTDSY